MAPATVWPSTNGPSRDTPNQAPNAVESLMAAHTLASGAFSIAVFSSLSLMISNLLVAYSPEISNVQPSGCGLCADAHASARFCGHTTTIGVIGSTQWWKGQGKHVDWQRSDFCDWSVVRRMQRRAVLATTCRSRAA